MRTVDLASGKDRDTPPRSCPEEPQDLPLGNTCIGMAKKQNQGSSRKVGGHENREGQEKEKGLVEVVPRADDSSRGLWFRDGYLFIYLFIFIFFN